jgi:hypothetical protein
MKLRQINAQDIFSISVYEKVDWLAGCQKTIFTLGSVYFFLANTRYGINRASRIESICQMGRKNTQNHTVIFS